VLSFIPYFRLGRRFVGRDAPKADLCSGGIDKGAAAVALYRKGECEKSRFPVAPALVADECLSDPLKRYRFSPLQGPVPGRVSLSLSAPSSPAAGHTYSIKQYSVVFSASVGPDAQFGFSAEGALIMSIRQYAAEPSGDLLLTVS
jgi:hypothetical protein